jgi:hypothetical protein
MNMTMKQSIVRVVVAGSLALASVAAFADTNKPHHDHTPTVHSHTPTVHNRTEIARH